MMLRFCLFLLTFLQLTLLFAQKTAAVGTDVAITVPRPYDYAKHARYDGLQLKTYYMEMRDGVRLAVDVYLPKQLGDEKLPALIHQTRYWRSPELRWPFKWFSNGLVGRQGQMIKEIINNGYAIVNVDARGSGASFGSRPYPWSEAETRDGADIIEWILQQDWSDGNIGSLGVSYSGTTAEFLTFNRHPNLKAVVLMYSLFDVYDDIAYPGGIFQKHFVNDWGRYNNMLDNDRLPRSGFVEKLLVKGVKRVRGGQRVRTFRAAKRDHRHNLQVNETARGVEFRDQRPPNLDIENADVFSPFTYIDDMINSGTAVYSYSGWMDGDYQHAAIRRHLNLRGDQHKLIIGPWEHSGKFNCSPAAPSLAGFDHTAEILKFLDYHLKGMDNGLYEEAPVHYFTMIEEAWKESQTWPPPATGVKFYLGEAGGLTARPPSDGAGFDTYTPDTSAATSEQSRWYSVIGKLEVPEVYPGRKEQTEALLHYNSPPMDRDTEITGHPVVHLRLSSDQPDGNFHVYLDDVSPDGQVTYITEGLLRGLHRDTVSADEALYTDVVPHRTYARSHARPFEPNEVIHLEFDLLPTSYLLKKGHRLRLSVAGADQIHFQVMHKAVPTWKIFRNSENASWIEVPVSGALVE